MQQMQMMMMMGMFEKLMSGRGQASDEFVDDNGMDGLRTMKALSKGRIVKESMQKQPVRHINEYKESWETILNAAGRPWGWPDVANHIDMTKVRTVHRVFLMFGKVEHLMTER